MVPIQRMEVRTRAILTLCGGYPSAIVCASLSTFSRNITSQGSAPRRWSPRGRSAKDDLVNLLGERLRPAEALAGPAEGQACSCQPLPGLGQGGARPPMQGERHALDGPFEPRVAPA